MNLSQVSTRISDTAHTARLSEREVTGGSFPSASLAGGGKGQPIHLPMSPTHPRRLRFKLPEKPRGEDTSLVPGARSLRTPPTAGRVASPRPMTPNCHRGSKPRRRPELRRGVSRRLGRGGWMAPRRAPLGEREQPRGLARP